MIVFYVDVDGNDETTMFMHMDEEFFYTIANYLKLDVKKEKGLPWGFISGSDLETKIKELPHEWILAKPEVKQMVNGQVITVQSRFTEEYIKKLKYDFLRLSRLAIEHKALIRWE
jgi:hypothetical protein